MREEIAEQLGVTPTPGGLEVLLRQSENNRMAHGGIVHMANGGSAIKEFGQILKGIAPGIIASQMSGGLFPIIKNIAQKFGGTNVDRLQNPLASQGTSGPYNLSAYGWSPERGSGLSGSDNTRWVGMMNVGGTKGLGKGAGGNFGQTQRMIKKEQRKIKQRAKQYDQFGDENWYLSEGYPPEQANYYANTFKNMYGSGQDLIDQMHSRGFGRGAYDAFERVAESPPESAADSRGRPQNWSEIFAHYQETGSFEGSPEAQWGGG